MTSMILSKQYYRWAGYASLPCVAVPLLVFFSGFVDYVLIFTFGPVGLLLAISGLRKGALGAKICAGLALLVFAFLALVFLVMSARY